MASLLTLVVVPAAALAGFATMLQASETLRADVSAGRKALALTVDFVHAGIAYASIAYTGYILLLAAAGHASCSILRHTLALNTLMLATVALFLAHKMCVLTKWYNALLGIHPCSEFSASPMARMRGRDVVPNSGGGGNPCPRNTELWMATYVWLVGLLAVVNVVVLARAR